MPLGRPQLFPRRPTVPDRAPLALVFSPHPDDECIVGGLPLRLVRESRWRVVNVAVTLGGKAERRAARRQELEDACRFLGFGLVTANLGEIAPATRQKRSSVWRQSVRTIAGILAGRRPRVIFVPHENDAHPAHVGTHLLVQDALRSLPWGFRCTLVETEFWAPQAHPNLLVELSAADAADLVAALACHAGEVRRNPYHARLPAWWMDNVRRGAELVGRAGGPAPDMTFATLYRVRCWSAGRLAEARPGGRFLSAAQNAGRLF